MKSSLFYAGQPGNGFGWGTCNKYLRLELGKLFELRELPSRPCGVGSPLFMPIADHDLEPITQHSGKPTIGYTFFEYPLGARSRKNAARYDWIFAGSSWCVDRLNAHGIEHCSVLVQGVDHEIFHPATEARISDGKFRIFSGGKFEWRKGQDLVIAAFRKLSKQFPEMTLVAAWHNPWPDLMKTMCQSPHIEWDARGDTQEEFLIDLCKNNGIPEGRVEILPLCSQKQLADVMRSCDLGVFPNRCEGGTNLVLMEFMACGKPAMVSYVTGHMDVATAFNSAWLTGEKTNAGWCEVRVNQIVEQVTALRDMPLCREGISQQAAMDMKQWTWARAAKTIAGKIDELCRAH